MAKKKKKIKPAPDSPAPTLAKLKIPARWKSPWVALALIIAIGFGFRISTTLFTPLLYPDSVQYLYLAQEIQNGSFFHADYNLDQGFLHSRRLPPLYPFLLALAPGLTNYGEYIGAWISILFSLATFLPAFWLGRRLDSPAAGLLAAGLITFPWFILRYASPVLTEGTFTFFFTLALVMGYRAMDRKTAGAFALTGALSSLAYLTRDVGITTVFVTGFFAAVRLALLDRIPWRRLGLFLAVLFAAFSLCSFPYWLHLRVHTGHWGLSSQVGNRTLGEYIMLYGGSRLDRDRLPGREEGTDSLEEATRTGEPAEPSLKSLPALAFKVLALSGDYAAAFKKNFGWFLCSILLLSLASSLVGMFRRAPTRPTVDELYFWVWILHFLALYALLTPYMVDERYLYPLTAPAALAGALGVVRWARWVAGRWFANSPRVIPLASGLVIVTAFVTLWPDFKIHYLRMSPKTLELKYASGYRKAARFVREHGLIPPGKTIMARKPFVAYYLRGQFELLPKTLEEAEQAAVRDKADYLAVDTFTLAMTRPLLLPLAYPDQPVPGVRVIYNQVFPEYRRVITFYDLKPSGPEPSCNSEHRTAAQHLRAASLYLEQGRIYEGLGEARKVLAQNPEDVTARGLVMDAYQQYYLNSPSGPIPLSLFIPTIKDYLEVNPNDKRVKQVYEKMMSMVKEIAPGVYVEKSSKH